MRGDSVRNLGYNPPPGKDWERFISPGRWRKVD